MYYNILSLSQSVFKIYYEMYHVTEESYIVYMCAPQQQPSALLLNYGVSLLLIFIYLGVGIFPGTQRYLLNVWSLGSSYGFDTLFGLGQMASPLLHLVSSFVSLEDL